MLGPKPQVHWALCRPTLASCYYVQFTVEPNRALYFTVGHWGSWRVCMCVCAVNFKGKNSTPHLSQGKPHQVTGEGVVIWTTTTLTVTDWATITLSHSTADKWCRFPVYCSVTCPATPGRMGIWMWKHAPIDNSNCENWPSCISLTINRTLFLQCRQYIVSQVQTSGPKIFSSISRQLARRYTELHGSTSDNAFWPGHLLDRMKLCMPNAEPKSSSVFGTVNKSQQRSYPGYNNDLNTWPMHPKGFIQYGLIDPYAHKYI